MSINKQIEEMRYLADEMGKAISTEIKHQYIQDERKLEEVLKANGWRKATDLAEEIFAEIEEKCFDPEENFFFISPMEFAELKKKYTEGE